MGRLSHKGKFIDVLTNWRLVLLGATGLVLSLASGWTTWDGMRNFTKEPILSLMITFGIQGVMLIVAWLIGESFATSMGRRAPGNGQSRAWRLGKIGAWITLIVLVVLFLAVQLSSDVEAWLGVRLSGNGGALRGDYLLAAIGLLLLVMLMLSAGRDIIESYRQGVRVVARNLSLWVMFIACMAASVFFSFDSLFTTIFPQNERARAADIRIRAQVADIALSINGLTARRRLEERRRFLGTNAWRDYGRNLDDIAQKLRTAPQSIDVYLRKKSQTRRQTTAQRQRKLTKLRLHAARLADRETQLRAQVVLAKTQTAKLAGTVKSIDQNIFEKDRNIITKTAEAQAEEKGIGETSLAGRGPKYRILERQLQRLQRQKNNLDLQRKAYRQQLAGAQARLFSAQSAVANLAARQSQLREQSELLGSLNQSKKQSAIVADLKRDLLANLRALANERIAFEQSPTRAGLDGLQARCTKSANVLSGSQILRTQIVAGACNPGRTHEVAANLYALNIGAVALRRACNAREAVRDAGGITAQLSKARNCLQLSGLPGADSADISSQISSLARGRDDKAHRFVVTLNAFADGNKLAYLALAIAFSIDALVFVSGLFGANVMRSPLSSIPQGEGRTARQLERMIENALLPDVYANGTMALQLIRPRGRGERDDDAYVWTHELDLLDVAQVSREQLRKLINAGAIIGSVKRAPYDTEHYFIRAELIEVLSDMTMRAYESGRGLSSQSDLRQAVMHSLRPNISHNAAVILGYLQPSTMRRGFSSSLSMGLVAPQHVSLVTQCLNAASTLDNIECIGGGDDDDDALARYLIGKNLYRVLANLADDGLQGSNVLVPQGDGAESAEPSAPATRKLSERVDVAQRQKLKHKPLDGVAVKATQSQPQPPPGSQQKPLPQLKSQPQPKPKSSGQGATLAVNHPAAVAISPTSPTAAAPKKVTRANATGKTRAASVTSTGSVRSKPVGPAPDHTATKQPEGRARQPAAKVVPQPAAKVVPQPAAKVVPQPAARRAKTAQQPTATVKLVAEPQVEPQVEAAAKPRAPQAAPQVPRKAPVKDQKTAKADTKPRASIVDDTITFD